MEKGKGAARSFCIICRVKLGQVTLVPMRTQLCRGPWEQDREQGVEDGLSPFTPPAAASAEPACSDNQENSISAGKNDVTYLSLALALSHPFSRF